MLIRLESLGKHGAPAKKKRAKVFRYNDLTLEYWKRVGQEKIPGVARGPGPNQSVALQN